MLGADDAMLFTSRVSSWRDPVGGRVVGGESLCFPRSPSEASPVWPGSAGGDRPGRPPISGTRLLGGPQPSRCLACNAARGVVPVGLVDGTPLLPNHQTLASSHGSGTAPRLDPPHCRAAILGPTGAWCL